MISRLKILTSLFFLLILLGQCKETYVSPYKSPKTGYLVVEGFIAAGPTKFTLSRVIGLPADSAIPAETKAQVQVEGNDNSVYPLIEQGGGVYSADTLPLNPTAQYRVRIQTSNGQAYLSDFVPFRTAPPIDSINWAQGNGGVNIYVNAHDPANATRYYQWQFDETWQYHMGEFSYYKFEAANAFHKDTVVLRADTDYVYNCWKSDVSTPLLIASTVKLAEDVVYRMPVQFIEPGSQKLDQLYSILVRQYALTEAAYNYFTLMKANTESLGSIFDAQPSELKGNIHSLNNPNEQVIGFISAGTMQQQRIFISRSQLDFWGYNVICDTPDTIVPAYRINDFFAGGEWVPIQIILVDGKVVAYYANGAPCVDCTSLGGSTNRPSYWPRF